MPVSLVTALRESEGEKKKKKRKEKKRKEGLKEHLTFQTRYAWTPSLLGTGPQHGCLGFHNNSYYNVNIVAYAKSIDEKANALYWFAFPLGTGLWS
jgi:hypothetical protein